MNAFTFITCLGEDFNSEIFKRIKANIAVNFGLIDREIFNISWNPPDQYIRESGNNLKVCILLLSNPLNQSQLCDLKKYLMFEETDTAILGNRRYNLNPGFISSDGIYLLTHKPNNKRGRVRIGDTLWIEKQLEISNKRIKVINNTFSEYISAVPLFESLVCSISTNTQMVEIKAA